MSHILGYHKSSVYAVAFSSDSTKFASGSCDGIIHIWDTYMQKSLELEINARNEITSLSFSQDNTKLAFGTGFGTIGILDIQTKKMIGDIIDHTGGIITLKFIDSTSELISISGDSTIRFWDIQTQKPSRKKYTAYGYGIVYASISPNCTKIAYISANSRVSILDTKTITRTEISNTVLKDNFYINVTFSSDSNILIINTFYAFVIYDIQTQQLINYVSTTHIGGMRCVILSPIMDDLKIVISFHDNTIRIYDVQSQTLIEQPLLTYIQPIRSITYSPDNTIIVFGADNGAVGIIYNPYTKITGDRTKAAIRK